VKKPKDGEAHFFVDESGDPVFYDRNGKCIVGTEGCSKLLILGFIETPDPHAMRKSILELHREVTSDAYLKRFTSMRKTEIAFHAKDDGPVVRWQVYKLIGALNFKAQFVVARKNERVFKMNFGGKQEKFYNYLVTVLFQNVLHRFQHNHITFSKRGSSDRTKKLEKAIWRAKKRFENNCSVGIDSTTFTIMPETPVGEPCLSVIDYMNWAVHRAYTTGAMEHYDHVNSKVSLLHDMYDSHARYTRKSPFQMSRAAPLELGS
jgi:hypothetical protein